MFIQLRSSNKIKPELSITSGFGVRTDYIRWFGEDAIPVHIHFAHTVLQYDAESALECRNFFWPAWRKS
jgi:hypothetical protein